MLVHSDPRFARLEESFRPRTPLRIPVHHTGFVVAPRDRGRPAGTPAATNGAGPRRLLVSAGGGIAGEPLLRAAVEAGALVRGDGVRIKVVAGPFLPEPAWRSLRSAARDRPGVELRRSVTDLRAELEMSAASVSQCGYNTALDLLMSRVPALVVPFAEPGEDEQTRRARRLERMGAVRVLDPASLSADALAREIRRLRDFRAAPIELDFGGADETTPPDRAAGERLLIGDWLEPVRGALDRSARRVTFFFRDDDGGWRDDRLVALLDLFAERAMPLDLALIPSDLNAGIAGELAGRCDRSEGRLGLHQHGLAHRNHEPEGRKCEFGPGRSPSRAAR